MKNNSKSIHIHVSENFYKKIKAATAQGGQSLHNTVVLALGQFLNLPKADVEEEMNLKEEE